MISRLFPFSRFLVFPNMRIVGQFNPHTCLSVLCKCYRLPTSRQVPKQIVVWAKRTLHGPGPPQAWAQAQATRLGHQAAPVGHLKGWQTARAFPRLASHHPGPDNLKGPSLGYDLERNQSRSYMVKINPGAVVLTDRIMSKSNHVQVPRPNSALSPWSAPPSTAWPILTAASTMQDIQPFPGPRHSLRNSCKPDMCEHLSPKLSWSPQHAVRLTSPSRSIRLLRHLSRPHAHR